MIAGWVRGCFNSLQTGKWILTVVKSDAKYRASGFQFPSNGKVDPNGEYRNDIEGHWKSFNSLQTGKWILTFCQTRVSLLR